MAKDNPSIVVIGGGTGSFTVLSSLKKHSDNLTAIVSMADDGGSTGVLRDELGTLPPGDVRQCLVALSNSPKVRDLFNYRFDSGTFGGHSFGNILLTALEKVTGNFAEAVQTASEILNVQGKVLPATLDNVRLVMAWDDHKVELRGERVIDEGNFDHDPRDAKLFLVPSAAANPAALDAIRAADLVVIAPGDLYTSLGPLLVIDGFGNSLANTNAPVVYVSNLVTKHGQTENFTVADHAAEIERFAGGRVINTVLYNTEEPNRQLVKRYEEEDAHTVLPGELDSQQYRSIGVDLLSSAVAQAGNHTIAGPERSLIRHDPDKLAKAIMEQL